MKKLHIILIFILAGILISAKDTELKWYDWNEGYPIAAKKDKLVLVDIYTTWCGWCKKMDRDTYADADVISMLNKNFVSVKFNPEKTDVTYKIDTLTLNGYQLLSILTNGQRTGYPTTIVINPKINQIVHAEAGYMNADQFKKTMKAVLDEHKK